MLMAIMIAENINNRKPEGRFSTFNLDLIEKGAHAGRPRLQRGAQTAASRTTLEKRWRDILQSKILFFFFGSVSLNGDDLNLCVCGDKLKTHTLPHTRALHAP